MGIFTPHRLEMYRAKINKAYPARVSVMVRTALRSFPVDHIESFGPKKLRKLLQNRRVYKIAMRVSITRIAPKRLNGSITVNSRGNVAMMVVKAELMMETPMKEIAAITRFTRTEAPAANCIGKKGM